MKKLFLALALSAAACLAGCSDNEEIGYDIGISKAAALMFNLNVSTATIGTLKAGGKTYDLEHRESLNAINLTIGIVFGR